MTREKIKAVVSQFGLAFFGIAALSLAYLPEWPVSKWSPFIGLLGQPFWLYSGAKAKMWGVFAMSLVYSLVYTVKSIDIMWPTLFPALLTFLKVSM